MKSSQVRRSRPQSQRPTLELLETRALLSTLILESEPNDARRTANEAAFDSDGKVDVGASISGRKDQDFFHFQATAAGTVQLGVDTSIGGGTKISVEDGRGVKLLETEPNNGVNSGSFAVTAGQDVYIRVRGNRDGTGDYTVHLSLSNTAIASRSGTRPEDSAQQSGDDPAAVDDHGRHRGGRHRNGRGRGRGRGGDEGGIVVPPVVGDPTSNPIDTEPNDRKEQANGLVLSPAGSAKLQGTANGQDDRDFFRFTATRNGTMNVTVSSASGPTAKLEVETSSGNTVMETEPNNGVNSGSFAVTAGTTYFIRMRSPNKAPAAYLVDLALS